ncbi:MAG: hypothetical protein ABI120_04010 [Gemmatimonadaceae bacterium]
MAFVVVHLANHLASLLGVNTHIAFMRTARTVYRHPIAETVLLVSVAIQVVSGITLVVKGWRGRRGRVAWLQAVSGAYLAMFLLAHVIAVLAGRVIFGLDTNFFFAAAGLHVPPYQLFFAPYYFFAVWAIFVHIACALQHHAQWHPRTRNMVLLTMTTGGGVVAALLVMSLAGWIAPFEVPSEYKAIYPSFVRP